MIREANPLITCRVLLALTARQCGQTTTTTWAMAHAALFFLGSLSVVACPAQRQSAEAVRRVREAVIKAGSELETYNVYGLELMNGSRVLALPGSDDSIPGLTWTLGLWQMRAARVSNDPIAALRPVLPPTRGALCHVSTAWSRTDGIATTHRTNNDFRAANRNYESLLLHVKGC
jgi:hypothetical protein